MSTTINKFRDMSSLFMRGEVNQWLNSDFESIEIKLERYGLLELNRGKSYLHVLRNTYRMLAKHYPNEYILKNEFLNQNIKELTGTGESVVFNEFRLGKSIADLVLFNGDSKVFEIKTILDSEYRLSSQILEYKKIFNFVYIIIPVEHLDKYITYDDTVGIISYDAKSASFVKERKASRNKTIDLHVLMQVLHTKEYLDIVSCYFEKLPEMNVFTQFDICKKLIDQIPYEEINSLFIDNMKKRNINNQFFNKINREFNQICLSLNLKKEERDRMINNLKTIIN